MGKFWIRSKIRWVGPICANGSLGVRLFISNRITSAGPVRMNCTLPTYRWGLERLVVGRCSFRRCGSSNFPEWLRVVAQLLPDATFKRSLLKIDFPKLLWKFSAEVQHMFSEFFRLRWCWHQYHWNDPWDSTLGSDMKKMDLNFYKILIEDHGILTKF